jgi:hypothetical protein
LRHEPASPIRSLSVPAPAALPRDPLALLRSLGGPVRFVVPGADRSRARVVVTLLHGNERSGFHAVHAWLRSGRRPAVDAHLVVANVEAALEPPHFAYRMLPGHRDLNRCFLGPFDDPDGALAAAILAAIREAQPECLLDIHNNTGHSPPYGVGLETTSEALQLVALFGDRFVRSHLRLGALMEAVRDVPSATVEVGRSGDPRADAVATTGLVRFLERDRLFEGSAPEIRVLEMPMRACLRPGASLAIADEPGERDVDVVLLRDLDRHNFERLEAGARLGWARADGDWPLELVDEEGRDRARDYFAIEKGHLIARRPLVPIMITTDVAAAVADCLFYVVREAGPDAA